MTQKQCERCGQWHDIFNLIERICEKCHFEIHEAKKLEIHLKKLSNKTIESSSNNSEGNKFANIVNSSLYDCSKALDDIICSDLFNIDEISLHYHSKYSLDLINDDIEKAEEKLLDFEREIYNIRHNFIWRLKYFPIGGAVLIILIYAISFNAFDTRIHFPFMKSLLIFSVISSLFNFITSTKKMHSTKATISKFHEEIQELQMQFSEHAGNLLCKKEKKTFKEINKNVSSYGERSAKQFLDVVREKLLEENSIRPEFSKQLSANKDEFTQIVNDYFYDRLRNELDKEKKYDPQRMRGALEEMNNQIAKILKFNLLKG